MKWILCTFVVPLAASPATISEAPANTTTSPDTRAIEPVSPVVANPLIAGRIVPTVGRAFCYPIGPIITMFYQGETCISGGKTG